MKTNDMSEGLGERHEKEARGGPRDPLAPAPKTPTSGDGCGCAFCKGGARAGRGGVLAEVPDSEAESEGDIFFKGINLLFFAPTKFVPSHV